MSRSIGLFLFIVFALSYLTSIASQPDSLQKIFLKTNDPTQKLEALNGIVQYYRQADPDTVKILAKELLVLATEFKDSLYLYRAYNYLGVAYSTEGVLDAALEHFLSALTIAEKLDDLEKMSAIHNNLSYIYFVQRLYDKAIESLRQSLLIDQKRGDRKAEGITYNNLGIMYRALGKHEEAKESYYKALAIAYQTKNDTAIANTEGNLSELFAETGDYEKSLASVDKALEASQRSGLEYITCVRLLNKATTLNAMQRYAEAEKEAHHGIAIARQNNFQVHLRSGYNVLTNIYKALGNYEAALEAYTQKAAWQDSIFQKEKIAKMMEMEGKYETKLKSVKIAQLEEEKALHQTITHWAVATAFFFCIGLVLAVSIFTLLNKLLKLKHQELVQKHESDQKIAQLEKEKLQIDLEHRNRQVVSNTVLIAQKNEVLQELQEKVKKIAQQHPDIDATKELKTLAREINSNIELSDDWSHIKLHFEQVHPHFFEKLLQQYPGLTIHEQKLCVYLKMKLSNKEISRLLNITPESVKVLKYRLKKKIMLPEEDTIENMLYGI